LITEVIDCNVSDLKKKSPFLPPNIHFPVVTTAPRSTRQFLARNQGACENILTFKRNLKTHLFKLTVLLCCIKRPCIFGPKGAIQIRYYYYSSIVVVTIAEAVGGILTDVAMNFSLLINCGVTSEGRADAYNIRQRVAVNAVVYSEFQYGGSEAP